ncbi:MAG TPA: NAD-dependent epimerase/dehydratase family protein [Bryobacteraceae bacterium]|nr:NAD-dependent epimerase/dehydratase family protein [Bryobacteraceae bacterium]
MVLVTGGTGFIGSHLVERLVSLGRPVRCLLRRSSSPRYLPRSGVEVVYGDLATGAGLAEALRGVDTVVHLAGVTKALSAEAYYAGNARATGTLLSFCGDVRRFVHVSSQAAAGPSADGTPVTEEAEPHPVSHYGRSKLASEQILRNSPLGKQAVTVRPPVVYGPRDTDVFHIFRTAVRGWMLRIGREERFFSIVYVKDLVEGLLAAAEGEAGRTYFLAQPEAVSWSEFGSTAASLAGKQIRMLAVPRAAASGVGLVGEWWSRLTGRPVILSREKVAEACCRYWICDSGRARRELGFETKHDLRAGMAETLAWYREAGWLK